MQKLFTQPFAALLVLAASLPASALEVGKVPVVAGGQIETRFAAQPDQGRAWIEVTVLDPRLREESSLSQIVHQERLRVPGLAFDANASTIVWHTPAGPVTCAHVRWQRILWSRHARVVPTGQCSITSAEQLASVDDGIQVRTVPQVSLRLLIAGEGARTSAS